MESALTIKDMPVDINAKLGETVRKQLSGMVELEFRNRVNVDEMSFSKERDKVIEKYRKKFKISEALNKITKLESEIKQIRDGINSSGFSYYDGSYKSNNSIIEDEIQSLRKTSSDITTLKHKLQTRLMLSTTVGEATVIMKEILGNTLIPCISPKSLTFESK